MFFEGEGGGESGDASADDGDAGHGTAASGFSASRRPEAEFHSRNPRRGIFLHETRQILHVVHRGFGQDAVAEIEDVAGAAGGEAQNFFGAGFQFLPVGEEQHGVEIALHGAPVIEARPAFVERDAPVEADDVGSGFAHGGQQRGGVDAEINDGDADVLDASPWSVSGAARSGGSRRR